MTGELVVVAVLVAAALAYLARRLFSTKKGSCDKCAVHQAAENRQRKTGGAPPSSGPPS